jgi:hypothetical protein
MNLEVREGDFVELLGKDKAKTLFSKGDALLGKEGEGAVKAADLIKEKVFELLPKIIAKRMRDVVPDGFVVAEISLTCDLSGKPFGIGVSGKVAVKFQQK